MLSREEILARRSSASPPAIEVVDIPEWGGSVGVRKLTAKDFFRIQAKEEDQAESTAMLLILSCCKEDGSPLFEEGDKEWILSEDVNVINRLAKAAASINGLSVEEAKEK